MTNDVKNIGQRSPSGALVPLLIYLAFFLVCSISQEQTLQINKQMNLQRSIHQLLVSSFVC